MLLPDKPNPTPPSQEPVQLLDRDLRRIGKIIGVMAIIGLGIYLVRLVWPAIEMLVYTILPFAIALILAYILNPIVNFMQERLRTTRAGAVVILHLVILSLAAAFFARVFPILREQVVGAYYGIPPFLRDQFPNATKNWVAVREWLADQGIDVDNLVGQFIRSEGARDAAKDAASSGFNVIWDSVVYVAYIVKRLVGVVVGISFIFLVNVYLLMDFSKVRRVLEIMIPSRYQPRTFEVLAKVDEAVGGFLRGMLIDAFLVGLIQFLGLYFLGLKQYALLLGIVAGIGNFIPYLGPVAGGVPAILYVLFSGNYPADQRSFYLVMVTGLLVLVQTLEGFVFQPKIVGKNAQLSPIVVLFALAFGANFGIFGMVVAVPLACIGRILVKELYWDGRVARWEQRRAAALEESKAGGSESTSASNRP